jgi:LmbE family N-acetylglucosaminyl deacetylase
MKFRAPGSLVYVPGADAVSLALERTTHLGIAAHQDDLEIFAFHGIVEGRAEGQAFTGLTLTTGSSGPRAMQFLRLGDSEMSSVRRQEQMAAADLGAYSAMVFLDYPSPVVRDLDDSAPSLDLEDVLRLTRPKVVYTHALSDRHATHVAVTKRVADAILALEPSQRPERLLGCEVWGDLDWVPAPFRVELDVSSEAELARSLIEVFASQLGTDKRYSVATLGRRAAHATFARSDASDAALGITLAMDMSALLGENPPEPRALLAEMLDAFRSETLERLEALQKKR